MRKLFCLLIVSVLMLFSLSGCGDNTLFLYIPGEGSSLLANEENFELASQYGIYPGSVHKNISELENKETAPFSPDQTFVYSYSDSKKLHANTEKPGTFYSVYDVYTREGEEVQYLHDTDLLCFYFKVSAGLESSEGKISEEEAQQSAEKFLGQFIDPGTMSAFTLDHIQDDGIGQYSVLYIRYIDGCATDETLSVWVNYAGEVTGYNGFNLKKYDTLYEKINKEKIDERVALLKEKIDSLQGDVTYTYTKIVTNTSGDLFVQVNFTYTMQDGTRAADIALINLDS